MFSVFLVHTRLKLQWKTINLISGLSYFENPSNTHHQCEESRKVRGQYFHEHGNVVENICKKSGETKRKAQTRQPGQTPNSTSLLHRAYLHFLASESSLVLQIKPRRESDSFQDIYLQFFKNISTLFSTQIGFFHTCQFHLGEKTTLYTLHTGAAEIQYILWPFNNHVIVAAATVASWFPTPTPLREAWVAKVPDRELEKAWKKSGESGESFSLTGDSS